jgi:hypothetical protein
MATTKTAPGSPSTNTANDQRRPNGKGRRFYNGGNRHAQGDGKNATPTTVIGVKGLKVLSGRVAEEYQNALRNWTNESKVYLEMRDDVIVGTLLDAVKLPLLAANIGTTPGGESTPADEEAAKWLEANLNGMVRQEFHAHVEDALESLDFGFAVGEITLEKRSDGRLWLKNIDPRGQETLYEWGFSADQADVVEMFRQQDPDSYQIFDIPLSKCVHVAYRGRKGNPQGRSLLRSVFRPWKFSKYLEDLEGIGIERDIGGMPIATLKDANLSTQDLEDLKSTLKNLRKDEELYLIEPEGVTIRAYSGGNKIYDVAVVIERKQKEILGRMFAQFLKLGMDKVGTQALVKGSQDFFTLGLQAVQRYLKDAWNQQLVPYLFKFNPWPGMTGLPKITWDDPGKPDIASIMNVLNTAVGAKLFTPTDLDEEWLRDLVNAPELPEEEKGQPRNPEQPPAFPGTFPGGPPNVAVTRGAVK